MNDLLKSGDYARKQIYCRSGLVRWSHGSRFEVARALVAPRAGGRLLDYGCGDGTFIAMVHADFAASLGLDVDPKQLAECHARLGHLPGVRFALTPQADGRWDVVTCMEVLEHCVEDERRRVIAELARLVSPSGMVVVSVPIEMLRGLAGARVTRVAIEGRGPDGPYRYYGHKGFDYRDVARELADRFTIARRVYSPMRMLGPVLNSQAWFVCAPR